MLSNVSKIYYTDAERRMHKIIIATMTKINTNPWIGPVTSCWGTHSQTLSLFT